MTMEKLKILVLHGCRQNIKKTREKTGSFRKALKKYCNFYYVEAPHPIRDVPTEDELYSWWFSSRDPNRFFAVQETDIEDGLNESIEKVRDHIVKNGPFDGIFAFSQGSALISLMYLMNIGLPPPSSSLHKQYYSNKIEIPTLFVYGNGDEIIHPDFAKQLLPNFTKAEVLVHEGGHYIPCSTKEKMAYLEFIKKFEK